MMVKRSIGQNIGGLLVGSFGVVLIALAIIIITVRAYPVQIAMIGAGVFVCLWVLRNRSASRRNARLELARSCADRQIERHRNTLLSYFNQSIRSDLFGNEDTSLWQRHVSTFLDTQVAPELSALSVKLNPYLLERLADHVDGAVRSKIADARATGGQQDIDPAQRSPREYEQHCASILFRCGWTVRPTPVTGDHGADVVAEKDGRRLIVQCKLYSGRVGNKAVQEVYAARSLYGGDHACVVAPNGFTSHAERAAHGLSVRLLHHSQLMTFAEELNEASTIVSNRPAVAS